MTVRHNQGDIMSIFNWLFRSGEDSLTSNLDTTIDVDTLSPFPDHNEGIPSINPANGLPMIDDNNTFDIQGNAYGTDSADDLSLSSTLVDSDTDNSFDSFSSFDDSSDFGSGFDNDF
jgi:hypothetical protein